MADDSKRVNFNDSVQPKAASRDGEFSVQPKAREALEKSLQPLSGAPQSRPDGVGASTQPKAPPLTTQSAKPPPSGDD